MENKTLLWVAAGGVAFYFLFMGRKPVTISTAYNPAAGLSPQNPFGSSPLSSIWGAFTGQQGALGDANKPSRMPTQGEEAAGVITALGSFARSFGDAWKNISESFD